MSAGAVVGLDVGGAHLKLARLDSAGRLDAVEIAPCPLWKGLVELGDALRAVSGAIPPGAGCAVTMTGELVDLWPDRKSGVAALVAALSDSPGIGRTAFYAGKAGFLDAHAALGEWPAVASANWRATAEALASDLDAGLLIDVGSTTTDLIPFRRNAVSAWGETDAGRLASDELVYLGVARTPVMALAPRVPYGGRWIAPMAEHFATTADVFRLTGDLPDGADLHPAADGREKTVEASARRLLRMVGADLDADSRRSAEQLAAWLAEAASRRIRDAASAVLSRADAPSSPTVVGAGVGRFLARRLAESLGLLYRDVGDSWSEDPGLAAPAADCAPAVAVARLYRATIAGRP